MDFFENLIIRVWYLESTPGSAAPGGFGGKCFCAGQLLSLKQRWARPMF
jgi:hypothetical protein